MRASGTGFSSSDVLSVQRKEGSDIQLKKEKDCEEAVVIFFVGIFKIQEGPQQAG